MTEQDEHAWLSDRIEAFLAGGLHDEEKARFRNHLVGCSDCARQVDESRREDESLSSLFREIRPPETFEDRLIDGLGGERRWWALSIISRRAASAIAAMLLLAGAGFVVSHYEQHGRMPALADLRLDAPVALYQSERQSSASPASDPVGASQPLHAIDAPVTVPGGGVLLLGGQALSSASERESGVVIGSDVGGMAGGGSGGGGFGLGPVYTYRNDQSASDSKANHYFDLGQLAQAAPQTQNQVIVDKDEAGEREVRELRDQAPAPPPEAEAPEASTPEAAQAVSETPRSSDRKIIRNGTMEFEVESFDGALVAITRIVGEEGGFVGTTNSDKLPNGKVKGTIVVRVAPDRLDVLVLKLRALGDLKSQRITAQDVTRQYVDLESGLRAARAMEQRLLDVIKEGKGEIKDLLAAEKELGVWREKSEKIEGELRYLTGQVSLSTLMISLYEKDIRTSAFTIEQETASIGVETQDVEAARTEAIKAIDAAKGRIIESDLKQHEAGQLAARIVAEVTPDAAGGVIDRLRQLGRVARLEIERRQTPADGAAPPVPGARIERRDTRLVISLYNLANIAPRETVSMNIAAVDVEESYRALLKAIEEAGGRVIGSNLDQPRADQVTGSVNFEIAIADAAALEARARALGEVMRLAVTENPDTQSVTRAKRGFTVRLHSLAQVQPRETVSIHLASEDVSDAHRALLAAAGEAGARVLASRLEQQDRENVTAFLDIEVPRAALDRIASTQGAVAQVCAQSAHRASDTDNTVDSKIRLQLTLMNINRLPARETTAMTVEGRDVEKMTGDALARAAAMKGRVVTSNLSRDSAGRSAAHLVVDVPLNGVETLLAALREAGIVRRIESSRNPQVPDGRLARARVDLTFVSAGAIVAQDAGLWTAIKSGLSTSVTGLLWSLRLIVIGLCFVGPWALIGWMTWRIARRRRATE